MVENVLLHLLHGHGLALLEDNAGHDLLAVLLVGHTDDLNVPHLGMGVDELLDLLGVDVLTAADDHVLEAARDEVVSVGTAAGQVARVEPAVGVDGLGGGLGHLVVALHDVVAAGHELAVDPVGAIQTRLGVDDLALHVGKGRADRLGSYLQAIVVAGHGTAGGGLGLTVDRYDLPHIHDLGSCGLLHEVGGAVGTRHDTDPHVGEVGLGEVLMLHHGDKHGGHTVEGGDVLVVDAGQSGLGGEVGQGVHGGSVGHGGGHGQHHAEAMEHGHLDHHAVGGGQLHVVADVLTVVDHVVVGQHNALGEARGTRGVLHVADVVLVNGGGHAPDLLHGDLHRASHGLMPLHTTLLTVAHGDDVAEEGETAGVEGRAGAEGLQLGAKLGHDTTVMAVLGPLGHDEGMGIRLAEQVLHLVDLVGGIDGDQHRAQLDGGPEGDVPLGDVGGPDRHVGACLNAHGNESAGEGVHVIAELGIGAGVVQGGVLEGVLVGELLHHAIQHLGEGEVNELILFPDVLTRVSTVEVQGAALLGGIVELLHEAHELGKDDLHIVQLLAPAGIPDQRDVAVVVDGAESQHDLGDGKLTLARQAELQAVLDPAGVAEVDVTDVSAQVLDDLLGGLTASEVGGRQLPQCAEAVAGEAIQEIAEGHRLAEQTRGLHEETHPACLGLGKDTGDQGGHVLDGGLHLSLGSGGGAETDVGDMEAARHVHAMQDLGLGLGGSRGVGGINEAIDAGDGQLLLVETAEGGGGGVIVERAVTAHEHGAVDVVDLHAGIAQRGGHVAELIEGMIVPPFGGKREFHGNFLLSERFRRTARRRSC